MAEVLDLLGDPVDPHHGGKGRPRHKATRENRNRVMMLLGFGWSNERIAAALNITAGTLRRHYSRDLKTRDSARDRLAATYYWRVWQEAISGNASALRLFGQIMEREDLIVARPRAAREPADDPAEPLGKKERAQAAARQVPPGWDDLLGPGEEVQH